MKQLNAKNISEQLKKYLTINEMFGVYGELSFFERAILTDLLLIAE